MDYVSHVSFDERIGSYDLTGQMIFPADRCYLYDEWKGKYVY
jgi:hypothetical protein